ncbi:MAG TPA: malto-oligosyltrehalose trehalohydrolase [Blastocatellia bacterium]|nr:malto-oligosyltrehalose trehalohydrolase [Blastocatellia bacterium]
MKIGARYLGDGRCEFVVWAPLLDEVAVKIIAPEARTVEMVKGERGYWRAMVEGVGPGARYFYLPGGGKERPDPASHFQPEGVHGPSEVVDHSAFRWGDEAWAGVALESMIIYELHVGTFSPEGTFAGVIPRLGQLKEMGVTAVEIMPVAQFPGERNWGYDGAYPYAVQNSYGGPEGLKRLVDACHTSGLAVVLDVVYNHLGPEGNYAGEYGPYYSGKYKTPWGGALNFDGPYADGVRNHFIQNAIYWLKDFHVDALRLDAIHAIFDMGAKHFLRELAEEVDKLSRETGRKRLLVAESDLSDVRVIRTHDEGGYGMDSQWLDDFHHSLRTLLTGERRGYYMDFGRVGHLAKAMGDGFVHEWEYSRYRLRTFGSSSRELPASRFVVYSQNHDQVGNRMLGERLPELVSFEALKLAAGAVLLSPHVPLLFMGEEYAEVSPFQYFVSHGDPDLIAAVRKGRREEFEAFHTGEEPPDPQAEETFLRSKLRWGARSEGHHKVMLDFYKRLIEARNSIPARERLDKHALRVSTDGEGLLAYLRQARDGGGLFCAMNFKEGDSVLTPDLPAGRWEKVLDSSEERWGGPGSLSAAAIGHGQELALRGLSFALYGLEKNK